MTVTGEPADSVPFGAVNFRIERAACVCAWVGSAKVRNNASATATSKTFMNFLKKRGLKPFAAVTDVPLRVVQRTAS